MAAKISMPMVEGFVTFVIEPNQSQDFHKFYIRKSGIIKLSIAPYNAEFDKIGNDGQKKRRVLLFSNDETQIREITCPSLSYARLMQDFIIHQLIHNVYTISLTEAFQSPATTW